TPRALRSISASPAPSATCDTNLDCVLGTCRLDFGKGTCSFANDCCSSECAGPLCTCGASTCAFDADCCDFGFLADGGIINATCHNNTCCQKLGAGCSHDNQCCADLSAYCSKAHQLCGTKLANGA